VTIQVDSVTVSTTLNFGLKDKIVQMAVNKLFAKRNLLLFE